MIVLSSECPREEKRTLLKLTASFLPSFFHSFSCSLTHSFIHPSICPFIHPFVHSFIAVDLGLPRMGMVMTHMCSYKPRHVHEWGCLCISEIRDWVNFFCEGLECRLCVLCHNYSTLPLWPKSTADNKLQIAWRWSNKTLLVKADGTRCVAWSGSWLTLGLATNCTSDSLPLCDLSNHNLPISLHPFCSGCWRLLFLCVSTRMAQEGQAR